MKNKDNNSFILYNNLPTIIYQSLVGIYEAHETIIKIKKFEIERVCPFYVLFACVLYSVLFSPLYVLKSNVYCRFITIRFMLK